MNQAIILGNLTKDPETRITTGENQTAVCKFTVAVNDKGDDVNYIPVVVFGRIAENCDKFLSKGSKVAVQGKIKTGSYEKEGRRVYTTEVIAFQVEFLGSRNETPTQRKPADDNVPAGFEQLEEQERIPF